MASNPITPELTRLMQNVRIHAPGAVDATLKLELFNVLDDFLQFTNFWQEDVDYTTTPNVTTYDVSGTEAGTVIKLLRNADVDDSEVSATMPTMGTVTLKIAPTLAQVLTATVAYTVVDPTDSNSYPQLPDDLLHKYGVGIMHGLIGRLQLQPAKPYTNQQLAIFNSRKYAAVKSEARAAVRHQNIYGGQTWRFPHGFAPGRQR